MKTPKILLTIAGAIALAAAGTAITKEHKTAAVEPLTVVGTLIDTKCYSMDAANTGNDHQTPTGVMAKCAAACATTGLPVALLTEKGDVLVLVAPSAAFAKHMAEVARVTGPKVYGNALRPDRVEVKTADGWKEISIATMM